MSDPVSTWVTVQGSANSRGGNLESCSGQARSEVTDVKEQEKEKPSGMDGCTTLAWVLGCRKETKPTDGNPLRWESEIQSSSCTNKTNVDLQYGTGQEPQCQGEKK